MEDITKDEEIYISNYYKVFYEDKNNLLKVQNKYLEMFYKRTKEILEEQEKNKAKLKKDIMAKVMERVDELSNLGVDIDKIDMKKILSEIKLD